VTLPFSQIPSPHKPTSVAAVPAISTGQKFSTSQTSDITTILKRVNDFSYTISGSLKEAIREINQINMQSKILSFNAHIESARAGESGRTFGVVATQMNMLSEQTAQVAGKLEGGTKVSTANINQTLKTLGQDIRATRLCDLAMTNIEFIDRNLYERSCDVRWWATDSSAVDALTKPTAQAFQYASKRLGVILDAYTVYFDIVICNLDGITIANGRPNQFACQGSSQKETDWFRAALATRNGSKFGFQSLHRSSSLANGAPVLVYSCTVRQDGEANGRVLGVLGVVFNWESLAQTIVCNTPISPQEKPFTRTCILDSAGTVLADTSNRLLVEKLKLPDQAELFRIKKGHLLRDFDGSQQILAHALSPGYEGYATGWHSLIIQRADMAN
jgi:hypothetical protein